jgi:nitroreductase
MSARSADHPILPLILDRWSPRAFDPRPIDEATLMTVFEAARWAPSSLNYQPWRFVYAHNGDAEWDTFLGALVPFNQSWASKASVLIYVISDMILESHGARNPSHSHSFDAGAAWMALALQAHSMGLVSHGMTGVDFEAAAKAVNLPQGFRIEAAIALGYPGDAGTLPEALQAREVPSGRRPLGETLFRGAIPS